MTRLETLAGALRRILFQNLGLKLLSLLIGYLMWFFISSEQMVDRIIEVPVEIINKPPSMEISNDYTRSVLLQIQTPQISKESFSKNIVATLDLGSAHQGENVLLLTPVNFRLPSALKVLNIRPPTITLVLEPRQAKTVPVKVRTKGRLAAHHMLVGILVNPDAITISGPVSHIKMVNEIITQTIDISGLKTSLVRFVNLVAENPYVTISYNDRVRVELQIQERTVARALTGLPVTAVNLSPGYQLRPAAADVRVQVSLSQEKLLQAADIQVYVDGNDCRAVPGDQKVPLRYRIVNPAFSQSLMVERIIPEAVTIRLPPRGPAARPAPREESP